MKRCNFGCMLARSKVVLVFSFILVAMLISCKQGNSGKQGDNSNEQENQVGTLLTYTGDDNLDPKAFILRGGDKTPVESGKRIKEGEMIEIVANPKDGFIVDKWNITGSLFEDGTGVNNSLRAKFIVYTTDIVVSVTSTQLKHEFETTVKDKTLNKDITFNMIEIPRANIARIGIAGNPFQPLRFVKLSPFYIAETEVTCELYKAVMGENPSYFADDPAPAGEDAMKRPVESVNWLQALKFCNALTKLTMGEAHCVYKITGTDEKPNIYADAGKKGFRLPTECEWEWAGRGGYYQEPQYCGPVLDPSELNFEGLTDEEKTKKYQDAVKKVKEMVKEYAWIPTNANKMTHQVKMKKPNPYKLYDMSGNVAEMCFDDYSEDYPAYPDYIKDGDEVPAGCIETNPWGPPEGAAINGVTSKGGSFYSPNPADLNFGVPFATCAYRMPTGHLGGGAKFVGFRIACNASSGSSD